MSDKIRLRITDEFNLDPDCEGERLLVKVQTPLATNTTPMAIVYDASHCVHVFTEVTDALADVMNQQIVPKAFFMATVQNGQIILHEQSDDSF